MTELNRLLQRHCDADIDFVIVGGFAAMLHGSSMLTRDLDRPIWARSTCGSITGVGDFATLRASAVTFDLFGRRVSAISIEDLIKAEEALGRHKDLIVAQELRAIVEKNGGS